LEVASFSGDVKERAAKRVARTGKERAQKKGKGKRGCENEPARAGKSLTGN